MTTASIVERVLAGDPRAVARAISLVEDAGGAGVEVMRGLFGHTGRACLIGVTGPPGAGKSTLVDRLTTFLRHAPAKILGGPERADRLRIGVVAVDPSSPFSGGAVLGDRIRMSAHAGDEGVFVRSMATRGQLGGLARATSDAALILDAAGYDVVLIETVGVGQDEVDIVRTADVSIVVLVPGMGDDVQALKAGVMEIADIFVVNKADRDGADRLVAAIEATLSLKDNEPDTWRPPVVQTVATTGSGLDAVVDRVAAFLHQQASAVSTSPARTGRTERQRARAEHRLRDLVARAFSQHLEQTVLDGDELQRTLDQIASRALDPYSAADALLGRALRTPLGHRQDGAS